MAEEEKTPKEPNPKEPEKEPEVSPEEEEFEPPVRSGAEEKEPEREPESEEKRFWYALRQMGKEIKVIKEAVGAGTGYGEEDIGKKEAFPASDVLEDIDKRNAAVLEEIDRKERVREIKDFLKENPDFKPYGSKIEKTALHPKFWDVSVDFIAKGFAYGDAEKFGAQKGKQADEEAAKSKIGGFSVRPSPKSEKDYWAMSTEEFEQERAKAKRKSRE